MLKPFLTMLATVFFFAEMRLQGNGKNEKVNGKERGLQGNDLCKRYYNNKYLFPSLIECCRPFARAKDSCCEKIGKRAEI